MPGAHERTTAFKKSLCITKRYELIMVDFYNPTIYSLQSKIFLGDIIIINTSVSADFPSKPWFLKKCVSHKCNPHLLIEKDTIVLT